MTDTSLSVDGRPAITIARAAARWGLSYDAMRIALGRRPLDQVRRYRLDERTEVLDLADLDAAMTTRPGRGANLRGHR